MEIPLIVANQPAGEQETLLKAAVCEVNPEDLGNTVDLVLYRIAVHVHFFPGPRNVAAVSQVRVEHFPQVGAVGIIVPCQSDEAGVGQRDDVAVSQVLPEAAAGQINHQIIRIFCEMTNLFTGMKCCQDGAESPAQFIEGAKMVIAAGAVGEDGLCLIFFQKAQKCRRVELFRRCE